MAYESACKAQRALDATRPRVLAGAPSDVEVSWGADEDGEYPTVTATPGYDTVRLYVEDARHTRQDAVEVAGFLLAAARAAGEETT